MTYLFMIVRCLIIGLSLTLCHYANGAETVLSVSTEMDSKTQQSTVMYKNAISLVQQSNIPYILNTAPWNRIYKKALTTPNIFVFPIIKTDERASSFHWFCPISPPEQIYFFKLSSRDKLHLDSLQQAKKYVIGALNDGMVTSHLKSRGFSEQNQLDLAVYEATNLQKLLHGRVDFIAMSQSHLVSLMLQKTVPLSMISKELVVLDYGQYTVCAAINKNSDAKIITALQQSFKVMKKTLPMSTHHQQPIQWCSH
ncbi:MAG: ABC transporter substrate-binding protein [Psychrobium sp.]|nr:ABC transporter substrate-binding protein [Psychrobium sp.]